MRSNPMPIAKLPKRRRMTDAEREQEDAELFGEYPNNETGIMNKREQEGAEEMTMITEHETGKYEWNYDGLYGVGNFMRKSDGAVTYLETGSDCAEIRRGWNRLASKTSSPRYPKAAPSFDEVFDSIASEYEFYI